MSHRQLSVSGLEVGFGRGTVLCGVDLVVPPGERLALLGANGSGKTTLLRTLSGAIRPRSGSVLVDGVAVDYGRSGLRRHRETVQLVTQNPDDQLFAADVFRDVSFGPLNLGLPKDEVRNRVEHALAVLAITDLAERPIHELSYGQRKRVAIAGALAMEPCVILLDEPTAGLDPHGVDELVAALENLLANRTTVAISTHDVDFALWWADSAAVLVDGQVRIGSPSELLADEDLLTAARLRRPLLLQVAAELGVTTSDVRQIGDLVAALQHRSPARS